MLSMGENGAIWKSGENYLHAIPPQVDISSTVGAGDSMVAALCWGEMQDWSIDKTFRFATAIATDAVTKTGVGELNMGTISSLEEATQVVKLTLLNTLSD